MVPYPEPGWPQVDTMKTLQGWTDVTVTHFRDLGVFGEQILLSIRYGDWSDVNDENAAKNWARYWRPEIQGYIHAYRAVTGVDLTNPDTVDATMPAVHLQKRLAMQRARAEMWSPCSTSPRRSISGCATRARRSRLVGAHDRQAGGARSRRRAHVGRRPQLAALKVANARRCFLRRCTCSGTCSACSRASQ